MENEQAKTGFNYKPLDGKSNEIRLVVLRQGSGNEPIHCHMIHVQIGSKQYEALSYEWGSPSRDDPTIPVDERPFRIRQNLYAALYHLRKRDLDRWIWIDALCIDQMNVIERNHQVQMMAKIYRGAERVVAWLGLVDSKCRLAMDVFSRTVALYEKMKTEESGDPSFEPYWVNCGALRSPYKIYLSIEEVQAIVAWAGRPYWYRIWIIQEIRLARELHVYCGYRTISGSHLRHLPRILEGSLNPANQITWEKDAVLWKKMCTGTMGFWLVLNWATGEENKTTLKQWILMCRESKYTEPRDSVYALLAVASDCQPNAAQNIQLTRSLDPDYTIALVDLYRDTLLFCNVNGHLYIQDIELEKVLGEQLGLSPKQRKSVISKVIADSDNESMKSLSEQTSMWTSLDNCHHWIGNTFFTGSIYNTATARAWDKLRESERGPDFEFRRRGRGRKELRRRATWPTGSCSLQDDLSDTILLERRLLHHLI